MEPKFIVVGNRWINVNAIASVDVRNDPHGTSITVCFIGVEESAILLKDQEAQEFLSHLADFKKS